MSAVVSGRTLGGEVSLDADAVVVGTGAGGAMAARELARAGISVIALEEGGYHTSADFNQREEQMLPMLFQDGGGTMTKDLAIRVLQGRGVGGSTVHNTNLCKRTPDEILDLWGRKYGVSGASPSQMRAAFERVEADLSVTEIPAELRNRNNDVLRRGAEALGWKAGPLRHNRVGCQLSGFCELGCAYDAKQNALKILVPQALAAGARVYSDVRVTGIEHGGGVVRGVVAEVRGAREREGVQARIRVRSKVVVLAGSATSSAALALASDVPDPHDQIGRSLRLHPGAAVAGVFDDPIVGTFGIPQSYECTEWLSFEEGGPRRAWIVPAFGHPIGTAASLPGFGASHMRQMRTYNHLAVLSTMVHDETRGRVTATGAGKPKIDYRLDEPDRLQLAQGIRACARILLAAGAREVVIPAIPPVRVKTDREIDAIDWGFVRPHSVPLTSVHPMGSMRMGDDPRISVVGSNGEHHGLRGLFVADGGLFPTSLGGPPQISIFAFALHLAPEMIARAR